MNVLLITFAVPATFVFMAGYIMLIIHSGRRTPIPTIAVDVESRRRLRRIK